MFVDVISGLVKYEKYSYTCVVRLLDLGGLRPD